MHRIYYIFIGIIGYLILGAIISAIGLNFDSFWTFGNSLGIICGIIVFAGAIYGLNYDYINSLSSNSSSSSSEYYYYTDK